MLIERLDVRLLALPLTEPFVAAHGTMHQRDIVMVRVNTDRGYGWGECSALSEPTYTDEFAEGAFTILEEELAPRLVGHRLGAGAVRSRLSSVGPNPMAEAALEMALLDAELRADGTPLARWLGAAATTVAAGAAVGLGPAAAVVERVAALAEEGYGRVKLKIEPGHDLAVVEAVRAELPDIEVQLDGNGAYRVDDLSLLIELTGAGISALEQPFPPGLEDVTARLVEASEVPVVADEAADSVATVERLRQAGALSGVSIKPPRLGGLIPAKELHDRCVATGLSATAGGMVEAGLGRHALAALAALPGFDLTGDLAPARRWLAADPWPDLTMIGSHIDVPTGPGVAPDPDVDLLDHHTQKRARIRR